MRQIRMIHLIFALCMGILINLTCNYKNPTDDVKLILNLAPVKTTVAVDFVDPKTRSTLEDVSVQVSIGGPDQAKVVDLGHEPVSSFIVEDGLLSFGFDANFQPKEDSPLQILLIAKAAGYLTTTLPINVASEDAYSYTISMINKNNPPDGISTISENSGFASTNGQVENRIQMSTPPETESGASASINIPAGTVITDADGQPLQGSLTVDITYFSAMSEEALLNFPGGFAVIINPNEEGESENAAFVTAGFAAIDVSDQSGHEASIFNPPIQVTIGIAPGMVNPDTEAPVQEGEMIKIWSYDNETGTWSYETDGIVTDPAGDGNLAITYEMDHLSWWNLDWKFNSCQYGVMVIIDGKSKCDPCLYFVLERPGYRQMRWVCDDTIRFYQVPRNLPMTLKAYTDYWRTNLVGQLDIPNLCDQGILIINIHLQQNGFNRIFHFKGTCENGTDVEIRPSVPLWVRPDGSFWWRYLGWVVNGEISICNLPVPDRYQFGTYYKGKYYKAVVDLGIDHTIFLPEYSEGLSATVKGDHVYYDVDLPDDICEGL